MTHRSEDQTWERYATEFQLMFGNNPARISAIRTAYVVHGFDVDLITQISGFPTWRVRQVLLGGNPRREVF